MIEMPPLQFANTNGIRMGYYEAGPNTDQPPLVPLLAWAMNALVPGSLLLLRTPSTLAAAAPCG